MSHKESTEAVRAMYVSVWVMCVYVEVLLCTNTSSVQTEMCVFIRQSVNKSATLNVDCKFIVHFLRSQLDEIWREDRCSNKQDCADIDAKIKNHD